MKKYKITSWTAVVLWMATIFFLSHQPGSQSSELSSGITEIIINTVEGISPSAVTYVEEFHTYIRKSAHFLAYLLLAVLSVNALKASGVRGFRRLIFAFGICVVFAMTDEFHQLFIEGRSGEVRDVLIDSSGAIVGICIYCGMSRFISFRQSFRMQERKNRQQ